MNRFFAFVISMLSTVTVPAQNNVQDTAGPVATTVEDRRNKVAILPFTFLKDGEPASEEASMEIQNECFALFTKRPGIYSFLPTRRTDVLLHKAGITKATLINYTMDELCKVLGVQYIVDGAVSLVKTSSTSYGNSNYNNKGDDNKQSSSYATHTQNYQTTVDFKIYNDQGETIYNQNRKAFWNMADSYKDALEYVVKRSPLYTK
ncbi:MAG: hypothetical protein JO154_26245 [Chitinophaga sp.]|uniref:hypothetical protein n=1 Tax=Chitinophaga sp. TaxID=1869181 RepID=UPI0025C25289|nr:hypothetical protein [Chitinophaga sp.]MBV8256123.1 hypothetical protein [Chitinophaga sp.]